MRKLCALLCILFIFSIAGCTEYHRYDTPVTFYYSVKTIDHAAGGNVFASETREGTSFSEDVQLMMNEYLKGPLSDDLDNPFPEGSTVKRVKRDGNILTLYLSEHFDNLPLEKLTIATACIAQTSFAYTSALVVLLIPDGTFIDGSTNKTINADSFLFSDKNVAYKPPQ